MNTDYCQQLLSILARLDRLDTEPQGIVGDPADTDNLPLAEELRELLSPASLREKRSGSE